ncbi:allantoate amidohydrolase [Wolffia australiana]
MAIFSILLLLCCGLCVASAGIPLPGLGDGAADELFPEILRDEAVARLYELGRISDADSYLERTFLSPAFNRASTQVREWMEDAGLRTWMDQMGNVHGRVDGANTSEAALLIGSHIDTVIDAGFYDGSLGVISAIAAVKAMKNSVSLDDVRRPVEIIAFSDEEGVRFQSTFLGSSAIAGTLPVSALQVSDKSGTTLHDVLKANSMEATEESLMQVKYDPSSVWGYVEVHIEQGPVLEALGYPLGVVKGIAGQTRLKVTVSGSQGHAGTVPMSMRQDPMTASAELILALETLCKEPAKFLTRTSQCDAPVGDSLDGLVCTVGELSPWPGASNVIPGKVVFTVDVRAMDDGDREAVIFEFSNQMRRICDLRSVLCTVEPKHSAGVVRCDPDLSSELDWAARTAARKIAGSTAQLRLPVLMSGAGHDAMAISHLTKVGMLFVRCRGGVSHSPEEFVHEDDVWAAGLSIMNLLQSL